MSAIVVTTPPDWFDLSKYDNAKNLDAKGWAQNIEVRFNDMNNVNAGLPAKFAEPCRSYGILTDQTYEETLKETFGFILDLIDDVKSNAKVKLFSFQELKNIYFLLQHFDDGYDGNITDRYIKHEAIEWYKSVISWEDLFSDDSVIFEDAPVNFFLDEFSNTKEQWFQFSVDLTADNQTLIEQFKSVLQYARKISEIEPVTFTEAKSRTWAENKILPYLDMEIWMVENNIHITQSVLGSWLFPGSLEPAEKIRKGPKQHAHRVCTMGTISSLYHQSEQKI